jgi:hypothetical protein
LAEAPRYRGILDTKILVYVCFRRRHRVVDAAESSVKGDVVEFWVWVRLVLVLCNRHGLVIGPSHGRNKGSMSEEKYGSTTKGIVEVEV